MKNIEFKKIFEKKHVIIIMEIPSKVVEIPKHEFTINNNGELIKVKVPKHFKFGKKLVSSNNEKPYFLNFHFYGFKKEDFANGKLLKVVNIVIVEKYYPETTKRKFLMIDVFPDSTDVEPDTLLKISNKKIKNEAAEDEVISFNVFEDWRIDIIHGIKRIKRVCEKCGFTVWLRKEPTSKSSGIYMPEMSTNFPSKIKTKNRRVLEKNGS